MLVTITDAALLYLWRLLVLAAHLRRSASGHLMRTSSGHLAKCRSGPPISDTPCNGCLTDKTPEVVTVRLGGTITQRRCTQQSCEDFLATYDLEQVTSCVWQLEGFSCDLIVGGTAAPHSMAASILPGIAYQWRVNFPTSVSGHSHTWLGADHGSAFNCLAYENLGVMDSLSDSFNGRYCNFEDVTCEVNV